MLPLPTLPQVVDATSALALIDVLQAALRDAGHTDRMRAPPPQPTTCCGRGCNGCVWEGYFDALVFWREDALALLVEAPAPSA
ncbi:oxidoreductase-like domain-containing protein [Variovorax dokdonensis]|uniref:Oxidoreductase-like domain-containing protein n=1 Tax=Variovorax dokdonensis TaxID=344883 RepID=A0ABT7NE77_9BURK|nr:oxidoreductase-like domain-containing protein [Variovorax dokdonensis]MDM0046242.1 oxidoreductase-like domain-containing protein [Variovorax dokdonensis]